MLKKIPACLTPELVADMMRMGHGDEILFADADFPAHKFGKKVIRMDGVSMQPLMEAVLDYFPLDIGPASPVSVMAPWMGSPIAPVLNVMKDRFSKEIAEFTDYEYLERFDFYEKTKNVFVIVITSEADGNFILRKGVVN